ncbi:MAG: DNA polymerase [Lutibacter sp.]|jgi:hypothetical protein
MNSGNDFWKRNGAIFSKTKEVKEMNRHIQMYTFDIETQDGLIRKKLYCWSFCGREENNVGSLKILCKDKVSDSKGCNIDKLFTYFAQHFMKNQDKKVVFVHNLSFEAPFIIEYCVKFKIEYHEIVPHSSFLMIEIPMFSLKFIDSYQLLLEGQDKAEITYNIPEKLRKIDCKAIFKKNYRYWSNHDKALVYAHNQNDVKALYLIMREFRKLVFKVINVDILKCISLAQIGLKGLQKNITTNILNNFIYMKGNHYCVDYERYDFVKASFHGGKTEVYNSSLQKDLVKLDVNSLYPHEMSDKDYPCGQAEWLYANKEKDKKILQNIIEGKDEHLGFIECMILPNQDDNYPILPQIYENKILFTVETQKGVYTTPELQYAHNLGYKITPVKGLIYEDKCSPFKVFVNKLYELKKKEKGAIRQIAKILLNAGGFGKWGEKIIKELFVAQFFDSESEALEFLDSLNEKAQIIENSDVKKWVVKYNELKEMPKPNKNVAIASFITAYSRIHLTDLQHTIEENDGKVIYSDSDCIVIPKIFAKFIACGNELGLCKIESIIEEAKYLAPKAYIERIDGKIKINCKGLEQKYIKQFEPYFSSIEKAEQFLRHFHLLDEKYCTYKQSLQKGKLFESQRRKYLPIFTNDKRKFYKDGTSKAWSDKIAKNKQTISKEVN